MSIISYQPRTTMELKMEEFRRHFSAAQYDSSNPYGNKLWQWIAENFTPNEEVPVKSQDQELMTVTKDKNGEIDFRYVGITGGVVEDKEKFVNILLTLTALIGLVRKDRTLAVERQNPTKQEANQSNQQLC